MEVAMAARLPSERDATHRVRRDVQRDRGTLSQTVYPREVVKTALMVIWP